MVLPDAIMDKRMFSYELRLPDDIRVQAEPNIDLLAYHTYRFNLVEILSEYLDIINEEVTNE